MAMGNTSVLLGLKIRNRPNVHGLASGLETGCKYFARSVAQGNSTKAVQHTKFRILSTKFSTQVYRTVPL